MIKLNIFIFISNLRNVININIYIIVYIYVYKNILELGFEIDSNNNI